MTLVLVAPGHALAPPYARALRDLRMNAEAAERAWAAVGLTQGFASTPHPAS